MAKREISRREFIESLGLGAWALFCAKNVGASITRGERYSSKDEMNKYIKGLDSIDELIEEVQRDSSQQLIQTRTNLNYIIEQPKRLFLGNYCEADIQKAIEAVFAEARSEDEDYMKKVATTIYVRAIERDMKVTDVVTQRKQYSYLNRGDRNQVKAGNALKIASKNPIEMRAYKQCEAVVRDIFENGILEDEVINHYFVTARNTPKRYFPHWAFETNGKTRKERTPVKVIEHGNQKTRFYYIPQRG